MKIILASQSPRRKELLGLLNIPFSIQVADIDETPDLNLTPAEDVVRISRLKAEAIDREPEDIVIAADTIVVWRDYLLGKPKDKAEAKEMLQDLSGNWHQVITGLTVLRGEKRISHAVTTDVSFRELSEQEIEDYIATGDPMDKAGAYGIQSGGALFVDQIHGDYYNVVGLPVCKLSQILKEMMEETQ